MSLDQELLAQIDKYKEIMQKDPDSREFLRLADLYRKLGVAEEATNILQDGLKKHPDYVGARLAIARIFLTQGQVEDATREFEEVIRQDQTNFVAFKLLGEIAMQKQEHEKAAERFGAAYQLEPGDQECKVMLDYIGSLLGRDITPNAGGAPKMAVPPPPQPSGETIAVAPEGEFGEFEAAEDSDDFGGLGEMDELGESDDDAIEEFDEAGELADSDELEPIAEPEEFDEIDDLDDIEPFDDVAGGVGDMMSADTIDEFDEDAGEEPDLADFDDIEEIEEFEDIEEEDVEEFEEVEEEIEEFEEEFEEIEEEIEEFEEEGEEFVEEIEDIAEIDEIDEDFLDTDHLPDIDDLDAGLDIEPMAEEGIEEVEELIEGDEELVTQIFQDLSDSDYTMEGEAGMLEEPDGELEDLMGLLESEESEGFAADLDLSAAQEASGDRAEPEDAEQDLESLIDLDGVPGMDESAETEEPAGAEIEEFGKVEEIDDFGEIEEFEEIDEFEEVPEAHESADIEEIEDLGEFDEIEEFDEGGSTDISDDSTGEPVDAGEESSIFEDFGISGESDAGEAGSGDDVFQDFDFDVFEQELLKDRPPQGLGDDFDEAAEDAAAEDAFAEEAVAEEAVAEEEVLLSDEAGELENIDDITAEETFIEEEFDEGEGDNDDELPDASLAELYIKQDLFGEATNIYRKLLHHDPADKPTKQLLEETLALQAYVEGTE